MPACSSDGTTTRESSESSSQKGDVGLKLTLDSGQQLNLVQYTISGGALAAGATITGDIPVGADLAEITAYIYGLTAGTGYQIALTATTADGLTQCGGSATFDVVAGGVSAVIVPFTCGLIADDQGAINVSVDMNECPVIQFLSLAPVINQEGALSLLRSSATDANATDALTFAWTTDRGTLATPTTPNTDFTCACPAGTAVDQQCENHLTLTVSDGQGCVSTQIATAICRTTSVCGNSVLEAGEDCDPPVAGVCNAQCLNIVCGDGREDAPETCDPPVPGLCSASCQDVTPVCGDGFVQAGEQCEPPSNATNTCDALCQTIPVACGNSLVQPGEECDPPGSVSADGYVCQADCTSAAPDFCGECTTTNCSGTITNRDTVCAGDPECVAYLTCLDTTGCADNNPVAGCYCGALDYINNPDSCFGFTAVSTDPTGACKAEIEALANSTTPFNVGLAFFDASVGLGAINQVFECRDLNCSGVCF